MRYFDFIGTLPCNWSSRAISSPTKLLQMSIVNKMKAEARYLLCNILSKHFSCSAIKRSLILMQKTYYTWIESSTTTTKDDLKFVGEKTNTFQQ